MDLFTLGRMPLGSSMSMPWKGEVSESERAKVLAERQESKEQAFKKFLDGQHKIKWHLCSNCKEKKLGTQSYTCKRDGEILCKRCIYRAGGGGM